VLAVTLDVTDQATVQEAAKQIEERFGHGGTDRRVLQRGGFGALVIVALASGRFRYGSAAKSVPRSRSCRGGGGRWPGRGAARR
jgi:NAD(P)-dependent dehydrogenase (short-subunit alcohol dehydrogenase family)